MKKAILFLVLILFFIPTIAEGADWKLIGESPQGDYIYIDNENIKHLSKNVVRVWFKIILKKPKKLRINIIGNPFYMENGIVVKEEENIYR